MARKPRSVTEWISQHLKEDAPRSRSLIVTIFGDSVAPYSDGVWLSDLIELLQPWGANERLVRTSIFRLTEAGWLVARRDGRRSYYKLATGGRRRFQHAYERVYTPPQSWDGLWTVVILPKTDSGTPERLELRRELEWEGFGLLAPGIFLRPAADSMVLREILEDLGLAQRAVVLQARNPEGGFGRPMSDLVTQCWDLKEVAAHYGQFLERFRPVLALLGGGAAITAEQAFVVQTLLIDSFRRVTLHDPRLPPVMLPADWPGHAAYQLCCDLYRATYRRVRDHLAPRFAMRVGSAPKIPNELLRRFGGLD